MKEKKERLLSTASRLYAIGMDLDYAKEKLRKMVSAGISFESRQMLEAYNEYKEIEDLWKAVELEYLDLKDELCYKKELA